MPYKISFDMLPAGYVAESAPKGTSSVKVQNVGFASSEDGNKLIQFLDGISEGIISKLPKEKGIRESQIDHLIAIIRKDKTATVYLNEVAFVAHVLNKKAVVKAGDPIFEDDIADIVKVIPQGISIPPDAGVVIIFSARWRKGLFFDYRQVMPQAIERDYDIEVALGQMWAYLSFQDRLNIDDKQWEELLRQQWFPFISLGSSRIRTMLNYVANGWNIDDLLDEIEGEVKNRLPALQSIFDQNKLYEGHQESLKKVIIAFSSGDYLTATALLYPRIEGLMRSHHAEIKPSIRPDQADLAESATADHNGIRHGQSLLLPDRFKNFLSEVYFASFDPTNVTQVSRHTVSHGVAPESKMASKKPVILGILILEQLAYLMH